MRRGHSGNRGWRNESSKHFRSRGGGAPPFRPARSYGPSDTHRYPSSGPRPLINISPYNTRQGQNNDNMNHDHHDRHYERNNYRNDNRQSHLQRLHQDRNQHYGSRQIFPLVQRLRQGEIPEQNSYKGSRNFYENSSESSFHVNNLGDVDHRQPPNNVMLRNHRQTNLIKPEPLLAISPWNNPPPCFEDKSPNKYFRTYDTTDCSKIPVPDYEGHRPPSSDHYGGNVGSTMDNSNTFSRSVDDTVDIIRKRLQRRGSQHATEDPSMENEMGNMMQEPTNSYESIEQEQPIKKKTQKQRQNVKVNCDKIKSKIVHQLFMMDKDKIHKLMDNPNSSSKFEFAISSLVTESQNSFNRHLRSVAEQSLCSSSTDFIHNDNNTIYEDTFMKQMQGVLDPQDTILLEDIKPMVLAELSKVLQLDDFEPVSEFMNESRTYPEDSEKHYYEDQPVAFSPAESPSPTPTHSHYNDAEPAYDATKKRRFNNNIDRNYTNERLQQHESLCDNKQLFTRRNFRNSVDHGDDRKSSNDKIRRNSDRRSIDTKTYQDNNRRSNSPPLFSIKSEQPPLFNTASEPPPLFSTKLETPLFNPNEEQLSDDDDPFAELDKQYHVAVDHNFIEIDEVPYMPVTNSNNQLQTSIKVSQDDNIKSPEKKSVIIYETQVYNDNIKSDADDKPDVHLETKLKREVKQQGNTTPGTSTKNIDNNDKKNVDTKIPKSHSPESKCFKSETDKSEVNVRITKSATSSSSRKRSIDQRPSHRKEKRKKSESSQAETNKQILNKNIIINVNDCAAKSSEKCDAPKSIFNLFFSKEERNKEGTKENKSDLVDKTYSDKYVKRKETSKKQKSKSNEAKRKHDSSSSSISITSPTDTSNVSLNSQTPTKVDCKTKLKTIDMFGDQQKKQNIHQAHRNTAPAPVAINTPTEFKTKPFSIQLSRKTIKRHISTQATAKGVTKEVQTIESKIGCSKYIQTERKKTIARGTQTDPVSFNINSKLQSRDSFERMKEIDMEIQVLLQEKFKLYSSMEAKESNTSTLQSLGMAVLNVNQFEQAKQNECSMSEVQLVDEFASIPVEDLDEIAFESVNEPSVHKKTRRNKKYQESLTQSPTILSSRHKKNKTPNISLLEQIITDDRPIEDIISFQDLEDPPTKSKKKSQKSHSTPKKKSSKKTNVSNQLSYPLKYDIKECSVVLTRVDLNKYSTPTSVDTCDKVLQLSEPDQEENNVIEEVVVNDIQFDMLDVSEDIVIGDVCEVKSMEDKDVNDLSQTLSEELIVDNSQTSIEFATQEEISPGEECKMYDFSADENLRRDSITISGNGDAVLAIECVESNFLAACLDGNVYYYNCEGQLVNTLRGSNLAVTCLTIVKEKYGTTVYTGSLDSRIRYYDLDTGLEKGPECNVLSPIQTMDRAWDTIFVGTRTGFVLQFECKNNMLIPVSTVKFSEQSILALRAMKEGPRKVLLVAARSEPVTIKDAQTGLLLRTLEGPKMTVYTLLFEDGKVFCGTSSHQIHVFDYASGSHVGSHEGGKGAVCLRATGGLVFAGCYDGCVYVFRDGEPRPLAQLRGPGLMLLSLAILGTKIIAGYKDRSLYIWKIPLTILQEMIL